MKHAQITLFLLLGMVFLITIVFLFFVASSVRKDIGKEPEKTISHDEALQTIKSFVTSCLEKSSKEGLLLVGFSGGHIPSIVKEDFLAFFNYSVAYGIKEPQYSMAYPPAPVPDYPYKGKLEKKDFPYFGRDAMHNLCDPSGPNMLNITSLYRPCESYEKDTSIQQQLVQYIKNKTMQCINFSSLPYAAQATGNAAVNVTIGMADVLVNMEYPFSFQTTEKKYMTDVSSHIVKLPVRLKPLHEFAKALIKQDRFDVDFDIVKNSIELPEFRGGFVVHKVQNACPNCRGKEYEDIFAISDAQSQIDGKTYIFQFARENRIPALDYIHDVPTVFDYDILVEEGKELQLNPAGKDPDEEKPLIYEYNEWKEDYDEYFDENCAYIRTNPQQCVKRKNTPPPHVWTTSQLYQQTKQNASIIVNHTDIGKHIVKVSVADRQNLTDYQNVTVFVRDIPFFNITGKSIYHDLPPLLASIEDPFLLQANIRCIFWNCSNEYEWRIFKSQFEPQPYKAYKTDRPSYLMPSLSPPIETIRQEPFVETTEKVKFKSGEFEFDLKNLKILQCLPHNDTDPNTIGVQASLPYPFQGNIDPFQASHLCCEGDPYDGTKVMLGQRVDNFGTYSPPSKVCYSTQKYICSPNLPTFDASKLIHAKSINSDGSIKDMILAPTIPSYSTSAWEDQNDIYKFSFTQNCSGNRGNVCGGWAEYPITFEKACPDVLENGQDERCTGPVGVNKDNCFIAGTSGCFNYAPGDSFEKNFLGTGTGICNNVEKLSPGEGIGLYGAGGPFLCKAQCNRDTGKCDYAADCKCGLANQCSGRKPNELGLCINNLICNSDCTIGSAC